MPKEKKEYYIALISISPYYEKILFDKKYKQSEFVEAGIELVKEQQGKYATFKVYHESEVPKGD